MSIADDTILAPRKGVREIIIKRRAPVGEEDGGHGRSMEPDEQASIEELFVGELGWGDHPDTYTSSITRKIRENEW